MLNKKLNIKYQKAKDSCPPERQLNAVRKIPILNRLYEGVHLASKAFFILVILLASGLFQRGQMDVAYADSISLAVDPPILQISATPPANVQAPLTVENRGDSQLSISIQLKPFTASDREDGQVRYLSDNEANLGDPLFFQGVSVIDETGQTIDNFKLDPKEKKKLTLSINLPKDSPSSDYYFSIVFLSGEEGGGNTSSSQNISGIGSNVLLSVGEGKISGEIEEFSAPVFLEKGPVPFTVRVKNTGSHFINPKGEILIKNIFGQTIGRVDLAQVNILANSVRNIPSQDYLSGGNLPDNLATYWPEKIILGPYKASLSITLSDTGPLFRRSIIFFAFPARETGITLLGLILLTYIIIKVKSKV